MVGEEFIAILNEILGDLHGDDYEEALSVIDRFDTLHDVLDQGGVLDRLGSDASREEATGVLNAVPTAVDEAIMGAVKSAFARKVRVVTQWEGYKTIEVRISEEPSSDGPIIRIVFASPMGHIFRR